MTPGLHVCKADHWCLNPLEFIRIFFSVLFVGGGSKSRAGLRKQIVHWWSASPLISVATRPLLMPEFTSVLWPIDRWLVGDRNSQYFTDVSWSIGSWSMPLLNIFSRVTADWQQIRVCRSLQSIYLSSIIGRFTAAVFDLSSQYS